MDIHEDGCAGVLFQTAVRTKGRVSDNEEQLDSDSRKKLYSFKNGFITVFLTAIVPWLVLLIGVTTVCYLIPHH